MENRLNLFGSKKIKWAIISTLMVLCTALGITIVCVARSLNPGLTFNVEFVTGVNDVLVQTYQKGEKLNFPDTPTKDGFFFVGWSLDKNSNNFIGSDFVVNKELTVYAKWQQKQYGLEYNNNVYRLNNLTTFNANGNNLQIVNGAETFNVVAPEVKNKTFLKWQITDGINFFELTNLNLNNITNTNLVLVPIYSNIVVNYNIYGDFTKATINTDLTGTIILGNNLTFELTLSESVNNSDLSFNVSSGTLSYVKTENTYYVTVSDFNENVNVYVNNITLNNYIIEYKLNENTTKLIQKHGEQLMPPVLNNEGYKLAGFVNENGDNIGFNHKVTSNMVLTPVWEIETYNVNFPKSNGCYVINNGHEHITNGKTDTINYGETLEFSITLSRAYSNSNINVYAISNNEVIYPIKLDETYKFNNVKSDLNIIIDNVKINTYSLIVDEKNYGCFSYGSWISVENNLITITENITRHTTNISALITNEMFGGWILNNMEVLTNSFIQDIENEQIVNINGKYLKDATRVQLVLNGGTSELNEIVVIENENYKLPTPTKSGYTFVGWFTTLVEVNTQVNEELSEKFTEITGRYLVLYAGWKLEN